MQSTAKLLAGAAGLTTAFVAGGLAKDKYNQAKFEKAVPFLPRESLAEIAKNKACGAPFQLKAEAGAQAERTFIMIKPDGVQRGLVGEIVKRFEQKGFKLVAIRMMRPGEAHLREHYADLAARPFFPGLVSYMNSGPVVAMAWEGQGAVKTGRLEQVEKIVSIINLAVRVMLGETNPAASKPGTIRGDYCIQVGRNICHGSDAVESAEHEIKLWFRDEDICNWTPAQEDWVLGNN